jgi:hypothetical protein
VVKDSEEIDYELIPLSPIRRLEKRMSKLEKSPAIDSGAFFRDVLEIVRMNQQLVNELARSNDTLRIELAKLPGKLDEVITQLKDLISFIKVAGEQESTAVTQQAMTPVVNKLDEMLKTNKTLVQKNDSTLELLDEISKRLKRPAKPLGTSIPTRRFALPQSSQSLKTRKPIKI